MRCLRAISDVQQTGHVYLSAENTQILEEELQQNFRVDIESLHRPNENKRVYEIRPVPPPVKITLKHIRKLHQLREKVFEKGSTSTLSRILCAATTRLHVPERRWIVDEC